MKKLRLFAWITILTLTLNACSQEPAAKEKQPETTESGKEDPAENQDGPAGSEKTADPEKTAGSEKTADPEKIVGSEKTADSEKPYSQKKNEKTPDKTETKSQTAPSDLFENVYAAYAAQKDPSDFDSVKKFAESSGYTVETVDQSEEALRTIKLADEKGDYVNFVFSTVEDKESIMTISYYQASSGSEVNFNNFTNACAPAFDKFSTHVTGKTDMAVNDIEEQRNFLFP